MNQEIQKPISEFTEKQREAYQKVMKALSRRKMTRRQVYKLVRKADIYSRKRDRKETVKMLIENPETPITVDSEGKVINKLARGLNVRK